MVQGYWCEMKWKTEEVIFGTGYIIEVSLGQEIIKTGKYMKMLDIWIDWNLNWITNIEKTTQKCFSMGFALRYLNKFLTTQDIYEKSFW